jgi:hypothetical protein
MIALQMFCDQESTLRTSRPRLSSLSSYSPVRRPSDPVDVVLVAPDSFVAEARRLAAALAQHDPRIRVLFAAPSPEGLRDLHRADVVLALSYRGVPGMVLGTIGCALGASKPVVWVHGRERSPRGLWQDHPSVNRIEAHDPLAVLPEIAGALERALQSADSPQS